jgi:hypothetical protein
LEEVEGKTAEFKGLLGINWLKTGKSVCGCVSLENIGHKNYFVLPFISDPLATAQSDSLLYTRFSVHRGQLVSGQTVVESI